MSDTTDPAANPSGHEPGHQPGFEEHLRSVEEAIRRLETGDIALEESIELYADAMQHLRACHGFLETAEARLEIVRRDGGAPRAEDAGDTLEG